MVTSKELLNELNKNIQRCNFCKLSKPKSGVSETRDGRHICLDCTKYHNFCMICGSLPVCNDVKNQKHYEEECFK